MQRYFSFTALLLCALTIFGIPQITEAKPLPASAFIRHPEFLNVIISPDGKHLAVVSAVKNTNKYQLAILSTRSVLEHKPHVTAHFDLNDHELFCRHHLGQ